MRIGNGTAKSRGFTIIELLVAIAIIIILAAVLTPNVVRARTLAGQKMANFFAHNVYKAAFAYVMTSSSPNPTVVTDNDCSDGYTAGDFNVASAGNIVTSCTVSDNDADGVPEVEVHDRFGGVYTY